MIPVSNGIPARRLPVVNVALIAEPEPGRSLTQGRPRFALLDEAHEPGDLGGVTRAFMTAPGGTSRREGGRRVDQQHGELQRIDVLANRDQAARGRDRLLPRHPATSARPSATMSRAAASTSARCEKACGKLPRCRPVSRRRTPPRRARAETRPARGAPSALSLAASRPRPPAPTRARTSRSRSCPPCRTVRRRSPPCGTAARTRSRSARPRPRARSRAGAGRRPAGTRRSPPAASRRRARRSRSAGAAPRARRPRARGCPP